MKIGVFSPYLDTLGGGERYIMSVAECLSASDHQVEVFWNDNSLKDKIADRFSLYLEKVNFVENIFSSKTSRLIKYKKTADYDVIFFVSDGSLPWLFAKKNIIHFQVPFTGLKGKKTMNQLKLFKIDQIICNSKFSKKYVDSEYGFGLKSLVVYPPVQTAHLKPLKKENIILSVGRLGEQLNNKKQEVLIEVFRRSFERYFKGWKLILVGGVKKGDERYLEELKKQAKGLPIEFLVNANFENLRDIYGRASIFWHAAGFGETRPERMEHFGIVVVEAMAAGAVPVVISKGGIPEIVNEGKNGLLWETKAELIAKTLKLINSEKKWKALSRQAVIDSHKFSKEIFCRRIKELIEK